MMEKIVHEIGWNQCLFEILPITFDRMNKVASLKKLQKTSLEYYDFFIEVV